jgi:hypothetical protein
MHSQDLHPHYVFCSCLYAAGSSTGKGSPGEDGEDEAVSETHPGMREMLVRAERAFDAPDVLTMFVGEMRQQVSTRIMSQ